MGIWGLENFGKKETKELGCYMSKKGREIDSPIIDDSVLEKLEKNKPPSGFNLPQGHLSHSQIEMYLRCPRQYYHRYVREISRPPGISLILGTGTHKALETTHHHIVDYATPAPIEMVLATFSDSFDQNAKEVPETEWKEDEGNTKGGVKDAGLKLVSLYNRDFAPKVKPQVKNDVRGIERKITTNVAGVPMVGYIDLIDTNDDAVMTHEEQTLLRDNSKSVPEALRTSVVDFKTKAKSVSQAEIDGSFQLTFYSYATQITNVRYDQLLRQKRPKIKRMRSMRKKGDYKWMCEIVSSVARAISSGIFPPCAPDNWACTPNWCGFWGLCRGKKQ